MIILIMIYIYKHILQPRIINICFVYSYIILQTLIMNIDYLYKVSSIDNY